jgi:osmoprotectant transport system substrate-binding protein
VLGALVVDGLRAGQEPAGLAGIEEAYGLDVAFQALDLNTQETYEAVRSGLVDALVLDASSPNLVREGLTPLEDDRNVFPASNVVVVVRGDAVDQPARDAISAVFSGLETAALAAAGSRVLDGVPAEQVARELRAGG